MASAPPPNGNSPQAFAAFCGQVATIQCAKGNHFLYEQSFPSQLLEVQPWPKVTAREDCYQVVLHQCCLGLRVNGQLCKNPTQLISSAANILQEFVGLQCSGQHTHAEVGPSHAYLARDWPFDTCDRMACGIEQLIKHRHKHRRVTFGSGADNAPVSAPAYPSASVGTTDPDEEAAPAAANEAWRKCKGCLWRLNKNDPRHSRIRGECASRCCVN